MNLELSATRLPRALYGVAAVLIVLSALSVGVEIGLGTRLGGLVGFFDVNDERSIPTWFSSLQLSLAAVLLAAAAAKEKSRGGRDWAAWAALAALFALLSADEIAGIHEMVRRNLSHKAKLSAYFKYSAVLAGLAFAAPLAFLQLGFFKRLSPRRRVQFTAAAVIFLGGAVGVEIMAGKVYHLTGSTRAPMYVALYHLEELMEMAGVTLFIGAVLEQLSGLYAGDAVKASFRD